MSDDVWNEWGIVDLLGHKRLAGRITEEERFGGVVGRVDVPLENGRAQTFYFGPSSIYLLTPTTEEVARKVAASNPPRPVSILELPYDPPEPEEEEEEDQEEEDWRGDADAREAGL